MDDLRMLTESELMNDVKMKLLHARKVLQYFALDGQVAAAGAKQVAEQAAVQTTVAEKAAEQAQAVQAVAAQKAAANRLKN